MSSQDPQPPKSGLGQSLGRLIKQGARTMHEWHEQSEAEQRRAIAKAKFPLFQVVRLLCLHVFLGLIPAALQGTWATVAWIAIIGTSLYCTLLAVNPYDLAPPDFACSLVWSGISLPWALTAEKLNLVMKRWVLGGVQHECLRDFLMEGVPTFCFIALLGLGSLGLWAGYWVGMQVW